MFKLVSDPRGEPATMATIQRTAASYATPAASSLRLQPSPAPSPLLRPLPAAVQAGSGRRRSLSLTRRGPGAARRRASCPPRPPARSPALSGYPPGSGHARERASAFRASGSWDEGDSETGWGPGEQARGGDFFRFRPAISPRLPCYCLLQVTERQSHPISHHLSGRASCNAHCTDERTAAQKGEMTCTAG